MNAPKSSLHLRHSETLVLVLSGFLLAAAGAQWAEPDPAKYREQLMRNARLRESGESFCWNASFGAGEFIRGYQAFKNPRWLEEAEKYGDFLVSRLAKDPDGYEGWIGPTIQKTPGILGDALVGDAILCAHLLHFAEVVLGEPELEKGWGKKARQWIDLSTRIMWEKWNRRGCYYQDAAGWGSYHSQLKYIDAKSGQWVERPASVVSENLNKQYDAGIVLLRLWRLTGKPEYRERVLRIFGRARAMFRHLPDEDRVVWNYWMPHGPYDLEGNAPKHWVAVHPKRAGYQAGEVADFVEVYDSGLVFERADIERMIRTNHWMKTADGWRSSDGTSEAGQLWSALVRFDETTRQLYEAGLRKKLDADNQIALAALKNVTEKNLGWKRQYAKGEAAMEIAPAPLRPGRHLSMALVIPNAVENAPVRLGTQTRATGALVIELLDATGREKLGELARIAISGKTEFHAPTWDGINPKTGKREIGEYRIRWTLAGESRIEPVWVRPASAPTAPVAKVLQPGEKIVTDFEGPLDPRWRLDRAEVSAEQAHGGSKSLKLTAGQTAELSFAADQPAPVRVTMWIHDPGAKLGAASANGPAWGVKTGEGDKFCIRTCWRKYLNGDGQYAWFNTGENQWLAPHPARISRGAGWSQWTFDFTDPQQAKLSGNGKALVGVTEKFAPKGAVGLYFLGGDAKAGPLHVDDVVVEYPATAAK